MRFRFALACHMHTLTHIHAPVLSCLGFSLVYFFFVFVFVFAFIVTTETFVFKNELKPPIRIENSVSVWCKVQYVANMTPAITPICKSGLWRQS